MDEEGVDETGAGGSDQMMSSYFNQSSRRKIRSQKQKKGMV